jgi:nitrite reductase (NO-forming)
VLTPPRRTSLTAIAAPGPILRGPVGDLFNVTLIYDAKMPHSIDRHASRTATDKSMRELAPEQSLVYQFQAQYSGIFMCHCGAAPALEHIANGMFGAVVIDSSRGWGPGSRSSEVSRNS